MQTSKNAYLTDEVVCDIYELTDKDRKNIQKLAREIEEGKGVAKKFRNRILKKSSYNASTILLAKITCKYQSREKTIDLLHNLRNQFKIVKTGNNIEPQTKTPSSISISICNYFKSLEQANNIFNYYSLTRKFFIFRFFVF